MNELLNKLRYPSIQTRMIAVFLAIAMIPLLTLSAITSNVFSKYTISILTSNLNYSSININNDFQRFLESIDKLTLDIIYNNFIQQSLQEDSGNILTGLQIDQYLSMMYSGSIRNIIYVDNGGKIYSMGESNWSTEETIKNSKIYSKIKNTYGRLEWSFNKDDINTGNESYYLFAGRYVRHLSLDVKPGYLIVKIDPGVLQEMFLKNDMERKGRYMLCDPKGLVIFDTKDKQNIGGYNADEFLTQLISKNNTGSYVGNTTTGENLITYNTDNNARWSVIGIIPYSEALSELKDLQRLSLYITLAFILMIIIAAVLYSMTYTRPIKKIVNSMRAFRKGNFDVKIEQNRTDEIGELGVNFNKMSSEIRNLLKKVEQDQQNLLEAELKSLIHQINPHFLYNTLDNINMLAKLSGEKRTSELITALSKLLRISLSGGRGIILVKDEMEHVRNYLLIQKMRYGDLFDFDVQMEDRVKDREVVKLILQPLVENAISHGFKNLYRKGFITVRAFEENHRLVFEIEDNGNGIPEDKLYLLNHQKPDYAVEEKANYNGYGIRNLNTRLRLFYGDGCRAVFSNNQESGATSKIIIPLSS